MNIKNQRDDVNPVKALRGFITRAWKCQKELRVKAPATFLVNGLIRIITCNLLIRPQSVSRKDLLSQKTHCGVIHFLSEEGPKVTVGLSLGAFFK